MPTGQADNAIKFTFGDKRAAIPDEATLRAAVEAEAPGTIPSDEPAPTKQPVVDTKPAEPDPTKQPAIAIASPTDPTKVPATTDDALKIHKIVVDGQELEVTEADLKAGHMRLRDYTQKTQRVADREKAVAAQERSWQEAVAQRDAELQAIDRFLQDRAAIEAYMAKAFAALPANVAGTTAGQPVTTEQAAQIAAYHAEQAYQKALADNEARITEARTASENAARRRDVESEVDRHISVIVDKYPILKRFEDIEEELMGDANKYLPRGSSLEDAKARLTEAAERRVAILKSIEEEGKKAATVNAASLKKTSTEPAGGTPPKAVPGKKLTLDARDRTARIAAGIEDMKALFSADQLP